MSQSSENNLGFTGPTGPRGIRGFQGIQGPTGRVGPAGNIGARGPIGPTGPAGPAGTSNVTVGSVTTDKIVDGAVTSAKLSISLTQQLSSINAVITSIELKAPIHNPVFTGAVGGINKTMVGLENVDNTSDVNKPVSTAQQAAIHSAVSAEVVARDAAIATAISASGIVQLTSGSVLTLSLLNNEITVTNSHHSLTTASGSDHVGILKKINGGSIGDVLHLDVDIHYKKIVVISRAGNIVLTSQSHTIAGFNTLTLIKKINGWHELHRTYGNMVFKKSNGVTNEYIGELSDDSPIPFFAQDVSGNSYAVMTASYNNMYLIQSYENNTFIDSFKHNGELIPFNRIVTTFMTNMSSMFENNAYFNEDITTWDTSSVTDMTSMFNNCTNFNQNISWWDVSNVQSMFSMFRNASSFNANISSWDTSNVTSMAFMFYEALAFHQNIRGWDTSRVRDGDEQVVFGSPLQYTVNVPFFRTVTNISVLSSITKTTADGPFEFIPTSNSPAPFHFTSSNTKIATVSGNTVTLLSPGSTTITVIQDPYTDQDESTYTNGYATTTLTVTKGLPSITLSHLTKILGSDPFQLDAVSNSNGALHYSINNPNVATVSGNTVTIVGNGTATITVTQEESKNFQVGSTTATLTVTVTLA